MGLPCRGFANKPKAAGEHLQRLKRCAQQQQISATISLIAGLSLLKSLLLCSYVIEEFFQSNRNAANSPTNHQGLNAAEVGGSENDSARPPFTFCLLLLLLR